MTNTTINKPKVLITGASGYIGGYAVDFLLQNGYSVANYDCLLYEDRYMKKGVEFIFGDVRDVDKLNRCCQDCEVVVLMASIVGDAASNVNPQLTREVNYESVKNICEKLPKDKHVIFFSTASTYRI